MNWILLNWKFFHFKIIWNFAWFYKNSFEFFLTKMNHTERWQWITSMDSISPFWLALGILLSVCWKCRACFGFGTGRFYLIGEVWTCTGGKLQKLFSHWREFNFLWKWSASFQIFFMWYCFILLSTIEIWKIMIGSHFSGYNESPISVWLLLHHLLETLRGASPTFCFLSFEIIHIYWPVYMIYTFALGEGL